MAVMGLDALLRPWLYGLLTPFHEGTCEWPPYLGPSIPSGEEKAGHSQYRPETLYTLSSVSPYPRNHTPGANAVPGVAIGASKLTNSEPGLTWLPAPQEPFSGTKSDDIFNHADAFNSLGQELDLSNLLHSWLPDERDSAAMGHSAVHGTHDGSRRLYQDMSYPVPYTAQAAPCYPSVNDDIAAISTALAPREESRLRAPPIQQELDGDRAPSSRPTQSSSRGFQCEAIGRRRPARVCHPSRAKRTISDSPWACPMCDYVQSSKRASDLRRHVRAHTRQVGVPQWVCCGVPYELPLAYNVPSEAPRYKWRGREMVGGCLTLFSRQDAYKRHVKKKGCLGDIARYKRERWWEDASLTGEMHTLDTWETGSVPGTLQDI